MIFNFSHLDPVEGIESAIWVCFVDKRMGKSILGWGGGGGDVSRGAEDTTQGTAARGVQLVSSLGQGLALPESVMLPSPQIPICIMEIRKPEGEKAVPYISST